MSKATEQRIKHNLRNISKALNVPFNLLLDRLFIERFLVRIGKSTYANKLILKGGICLAQIIDLGRETKDMDFLLTRMKASLKTVRKIIEEIASIDIGDDFIFSKLEVSQLPIQHKKHPGYRLSLQGALGQIRNKISIDIGVGDVVYPKSLEIKLMKFKEPLFEESVSLDSYTPEYIFSEKFESILYLGDSNSRMKDFYDCYRLIEANVLNGNLLNKALHETMKNRGTKMQPIHIDSESLESRWKSFLKKNKVNNLDLNIVISKINAFILKNGMTKK